MGQLVRSHERLREHLAALVALGNAADVDLDVLAGLVAWFEGPGARHEALGAPDFEAISAEMEARRGRAGSKA